VLSSARQKVKASSMLPSSARRTASSRKQPGDLMGVVPVGQQGTDGVARPDHNVTSPGHVCYLASGWQLLPTPCPERHRAACFAFRRALKWGKPSRCSSRSVSGIPERPGNQPAGISFFVAKTWRAAFSASGISARAASRSAKPPAGVEPIRFRNGLPKIPI